MQGDKINKQLIRKYIHEECTAEELEQIRRLMSLPGAQAWFDEVLSENWTGLAQEKDTDQERLNIKLQHFYDRLSAAEEKAVQEKDTITPLLLQRRSSYLKYAAVLALTILSITAYKLLQFKKTPGQKQFAMQQLTNPYGHRSKITLPDNSEVFLGAGSTLRYPKQFQSGNREVSLEGEAFFQVTKNPKQPFIIHTRSVQTMVLGTSFKIEAFKNHPLVVAVATGKVRVDDYAGNHKKSLAILTPGQKVIYNEGAPVLAAAAIGDVEAWKDGRLVFNQRPLKDITAELERWYDVKINYRNKAKAGEVISITLQANIPLSKIMTVLGATGHFNYKINNKQVTIH